MEVSEIMTEHPIVIQAKDPIRQAVQKLREGDIRHLPVMKNSELVGMLSERDIRGLSFLSADRRYEDILDRPTSDFMSAGLVSIDADADVSELVEILIEGKFGAVPVVDGHDQKLVGIVSYVDVLKALRESIE